MPSPPLGHRDNEKMHRAALQRDLGLRALGNALAQPQLPHPGTMATPTPLVLPLAVELFQAPADPVPYQRGGKELLDQEVATEAEALPTHEVTRLVGLLQESATLIRRKERALLAREQEVRVWEGKDALLAGLPEMRARYAMALEAARRSCGQQLEDAVATVQRELQVGVVISRYREVILTLTIQRSCLPRHLARMLTLPSLPLRHTTRRASSRSGRRLPPIAPAARRRASSPPASRSTRTAAWPWRPASSPRCGSRSWGSGTRSPCLGRPRWSGSCASAPTP